MAVLINKGTQSWFARTQISILSLQNLEFPERSSLGSFIYSVEMASATLYSAKDSSLKQLLIARDCRCNLHPADRGECRRKGKGKKGSAYWSTGITSSPWPPPTIIWLERAILSLHVSPWPKWAAYPALLSQLSSSPGHSRIPWQVAFNLLSGPAWVSFLVQTSRGPTKSSTWQGG